MKQTLIMTTALQRLTDTRQLAQICGDGASQCVSIKVEDFETTELAVFIWNGPDKTVVTEAKID